MNTAETLVVGAGMAGLACAGALREAGRRVRVVEKSRGVGGRCATRRVGGQPVDHGLGFLHGSHPGFLALLRGVEGALPGWPARVRGAGRPCQATAFAPGQERMAYRQGVNALPRHLARGLDVIRGERVVSLEPGRAGLRVRAESGTSWTAGAVVLTPPAEQMGALLAPLEGAGRGLAAARELLRMAGCVPCLTVIALYGADAPLPDWDVWYPERSAALQLVSHDSAKRTRPEARALVAQAHPRWSRERLESPPEAWSARLLEELTRIAGPWAGRPLRTDTQRWRFARIEGGPPLAGPVLLELPGGARLGLAGELFGRQAGVEAAWHSGRELARRLISGSEPS